MFKFLVKYSFVLICLLPFCAQAAATTYIFDTVTSVDMHSSLPRIIGIEKDTGNPLDIPFVDTTNIEHQYIVNRCVPVFLTVIEKPGRYYLYLTVNPTQTNLQLVGCRLELK